MSGNATSLNKDIKNPYDKKNEQVDLFNANLKNLLDNKIEEKQGGDNIEKLAIPSVFGAGPKTVDKKPFERK